jgi:excisionase family DNA binding protein
MLKSVDEAARYLGLQPSTLRRWIYERRFPVIKLGRRVLIRQEVLDELIRKGERPALRNSRDGAGE